MAFFRRSRWLSKLGLRRPLEQRLFGFVERSQRLARRFKTVILLGTVFLLTLLLAASSSGRYLARWLETRSRWALLQTVGLSPSRAEIDADWRRKRLYDI